MRRIVTRYYILICLAAVGVGLCILGVYCGYRDQARRKERAKVMALVRELGGMILEVDPSTGEVLHPKSARSESVWRWGHSVSNKIILVPKSTASDTLAKIRQSPDAWEVRAVLKP